MRKRPLSVGNYFEQRTNPLTDEVLGSLSQRAGSGTITDSEGLRRAYQQGDAYTHGKTLYVAGSHTARDWQDDVLRIPFWRGLFGGSHSIERLEMAEKAARATRPEVVVGHSLGGAVALQMQKETGVRTRTYGAPVLDPLGTSPGDRWRSYGDPFSVLDRGAKSSLDAPAANLSLFHSYEATASRNSSSGDAPIVENGAAVINE